MRPLVAAKSPIWSLCDLYGHAQGFAAAVSQIAAGLCKAHAAQPQPMATQPDFPQLAVVNPAMFCNWTVIAASQATHYNYQRVASFRSCSCHYVNRTPWKPVRDLPTISQRASTFLDRICYAYQYLNGKTETDPPESRYARARRGFTNPLLTSQPSRREASTRIRSPVFVEASHFSIYCVRGITGVRRDLLIEPRAVAHPVSCEVVAAAWPSDGSRPPLPADAVHWRPGIAGALRMGIVH